MNKDSKGIWLYIAIVIVAVLLSRTWSAEEREQVWNNMDQTRYK
jgi:hypothetical protein